MALPHLLKYIYTQGSEEVIRRGKKIHAVGYVDLVEHDELFGSATFRVKDDNYATNYKVYVNQYKDPKALSIRCTCPYNLGEICRHEAAALLRLQEMLDKGLLLNGERAYDQNHTVAKMKTIEIKTLRLLSSPEIYLEAEEYLKTQKPVIESAVDELVKARVVIDGDPYRVLLRRNEERTFDTSSDYVDTDHPLCLPKIIVFLHLHEKFGAHYFDTIRNWDKEKNKLLELYGYSLSDDLEGKFEFTYKEGKPYLRVLDSSIKRITAPVSAAPRRLEPVVAEPEPEAPKPDQKERAVGIVFNCNKPTFPWFQVDLVEGEATAEAGFIGTVQKLELARYIELDAFSETDKTLITVARKLQESELNKYLNRNSPFSGFWENIVQTEGEELPEETKALVAEYLLPRLRKLAQDFSSSPVYILPKGKSFNTAHLERAAFNAAPLVPQFSVAPAKKGYEIDCFLKPESVAWG
ncbi:MAG: helicase SNF2, partial [Chitinophagaceae bacterium]